MDTRGRKATKALVGFVSVLLLLQTGCARKRQTARVDRAPQPAAEQQVASSVEMQNDYNAGDTTQYNAGSTSAHDGMNTGYGQGTADTGTAWGTPGAYDQGYDVAQAPYGAQNQAPTYDTQEAPAYDTQAPAWGDAGQAQAYGTQGPNHGNAAPAEAPRFQASNQFQTSYGAPPAPAWDQGGDQQWKGTQGAYDASSYGDTAQDTQGGWNVTPAQGYNQGSTGVDNTWQPAPALDASYDAGAGDPLMDERAQSYDRWTPEQTEASSSSSRAYVVQKGDTLWGLSRRFNTSVRKLVDLNGISDKSLLYIGQKLQIP